MTADQPGRGPGDGARGAGARPGDTTDTEDSSDRDDSVGAAGAVDNPVFARLFDRFAARNEARGQALLRAELLRGLSGRVIELGAGNGLNFPHYPAEVIELVAVEPEPFLRRMARDAARSAPVTTRVVAGLADEIPVADAAFDAAVVSGLLCSVHDARRTLAEVGRVLRPTGRLRFYEHVRSRSPAFARWQARVDLIWPRLMGGCHTTRDTLAAIKDAGFVVERCRGLRFPPGARFSPVAPRILGSAVRANT
jgi:SAM-dependent methyltransferase